MSKSLNLSRGSWQLGTAVSYALDYAQVASIGASVVLGTPIAGAVAVIASEFVKPIKDVVVTLGVAKICQMVKGETQGFDLPFLQKSTDYRNFLITNVGWDVAMAGIDVGNFTPAFGITSGITFVDSLSTPIKTPVLGAVGVGIGKISGMR